MKGEREIAVDEARATIRNFTHFTTHSRELVATSAALLARSYELCALNPETNVVKSLKIDLKVGLTFATIAMQRPSERKRNQQNARIAYDTVMHHVERMHFSSADEAEIQARAAKLRAALQQLGESV